MRTGHVIAAAILVSAAAAAQAQSERLAGRSPFVDLNCGLARDGRPAFAAAIHPSDGTIFAVYWTPSPSEWRGIVIAPGSGSIRSNTSIQDLAGEMPATAPAIAIGALQETVMVAFSTNRRAAVLTRSYSTAFVPRGDLISQVPNHDQHSAVGIIQGSSNPYLLYSSAPTSAGLFSLQGQLLRYDGGREGNPTTFEMSGRVGCVVSRAGNRSLLVFMAPAESGLLIDVRFRHFSGGTPGPVGKLATGLSVGPCCAAWDDLREEWFMASELDGHVYYIRTSGVLTQSIGQGELTGDTGDLFHAPAVTWNPTSMRFALAWVRERNGNRTLEVRALSPGTELFIDWIRFETAANASAVPNLLSLRASSELLLAWGDGSLKANSRFLDTIENPSVEALTQVRLWPDPPDLLPHGGHVRTQTVVLVADHVSHERQTFPGISRRIDVEVLPLDRPFTGTATGLANTDDYDDGEVEVTVDLSAAVSYHWRARAVDSDGRSSGWVEFPGDGADFISQPDLAPSAGGGGQAGLASGQAIPTGHLIYERAVVFEADLDDADDDAVALEVETARDGAPFNGTPTFTSGRVPAGGRARVVAMLEESSSYRWRFRARDELGVAGDWTAFSPAGGADFKLGVFGSMAGPGCLSSTPASGGWSGVLALALLLLQRRR